MTDQSLAAETRWTPGAWLTLTAAVLLCALWWVAIPLAALTAPTDGWLSTFPYFELTANLTGEASALQPGDHVLAVDGRPLGFARQASLRLADLQAGQRLRYTVDRHGQTLTVAVTVRRLPASAYFAYLQYQLAAGGLGGLVIVPLSLAIAAFVFLRRPGNSAARFMLLVFTLMAIGFQPGPSAIYTYSYPWPWNFLSVAGNVMVFTGLFPTCILFLLAFPAPWWALRRWPRAFPLLLYGGLSAAVLPDIWLQTTGRTVGDGAWVNVIPALSILGFVLTLLLTLIHSFFGVRDPEQRAQVRWATYGLAVGWGVGLVGAFLSALALGDTPNARAASALFISLQIAVPVSFAIAILRYRLWDIDVIIRRTLIYSALTALLALTYFGLVAGLQAAVTAVGGARSEWITVASTLAVAALVAPLRGRIQAFIDRRFYRRKYDAARVLSAFGAAARDETDLNTLTARLAGIVQETMEPESLEVRLRPQPRDRPAR